MGLDPNDGRKPSIQVAEAIKRDIISGKYAPEEQIPSVPDLVRVYGVAKQTVSNAIKQLQEEGYLVSRVGSGTFVRTDFAEVKTEPTLNELAEAVEGMRGDIRHLDEVMQAAGANELEQLRDEVAKLRRDVATLQTQLIDLYGRTGNQYPHTGTSSTHVSSQERVRRTG